LVNPDILEVWKNDHFDIFSGVHSPQDVSPFQRARHPSLPIDLAAFAELFSHWSRVAKTRNAPLCKEEMRVFVPCECG
jgi:hypothetical protein